MKYLSKVTATKTNKPRRILLYGVEGVGKSTFAANAPSPIFIRTEDGLNDIDTQAFPLGTSYADVMQQTYELGQHDHDFKTLVLDSVDWFEQLIWQLVCSEKGKDAITDFDFGKGYGRATQYFQEWMTLADICHTKGMHIIILAHCKVERYNDPAADSYDRYMPRLHKDASSILREWANEVLFATYQVFTSTKDVGFGKEETKGIGSGARVIKTNERPSHKAKNRLNMPDEIPLSWADYYSYVERNNASGSDSSSAD